MVREDAGLRVEVCEDHREMSRRAAAFIIQAIRDNPMLVLCAATGVTPLGTYQQLAEEYRVQSDLFAQMRVVKLDEWHGLAPHDPATCEVFLQNHLLHPLAISEARVIGFRSDVADAEAECRRVAGEMAAWGMIDLCLLGLGLNGHLGLNEPGETLQVRCHVANLAKTTQSHSMLHAVKQRPAQGMTLGMGDLLQSRRILLLVSGSHKRDVLRRMLDGAISTQFPASLLHVHADTRVLCDREAIG
jgi:galactosamine-6-phosphate isomerase